MNAIEQNPVWIQKEYPPEHSHCYGCGTMNPHGNGLKTYLAGEEAVSRFTPEVIYSGGVPGNVYGGMIASLFDCHGAASAAAFHRQRSQAGRGDLARFVTASLLINFIAPTPQNGELTIRGTLESIDGRKVRVRMQMEVDGVVCASAEMLAIALRT